MTNQPSTSSSTFTIPPGSAAALLASTATTQVAAPAPDLSFKARWFSAGMFGAIASGLTVSWEAFDSLGTPCDGMLCGISDFFAACFVFVAGYLGGGIAVHQVAKFLDSPGDGHPTRALYARKGAEAIPTLLIWLVIFFLGGLAVYSGLFA